MELACTALCRVDQSSVSQYRNDERASSVEPGNNVEKGETRRETRNVNVQLDEARAVPSIGALCAIREADVKLAASIRGVERRLARVEASRHLWHHKLSVYFIPWYRTMRTPSSVSGPGELGAGSATTTLQPPYEML